MHQLGLCYRYHIIDMRKAYEIFMSNEYTFSKREILKMIDEGLIQGLSLYEEGKLYETIVSDPFFLKFDFEFPNLEFKYELIMYKFISLIEEGYEARNKEVYSKIADFYKKKNKLKEEEKWNKKYNESKRNDELYSYFLF